MPKFVLRSKTDDNVAIELEAETIMDACVDAIYELGYSLCVPGMPANKPAVPAVQEFETAAKLLAHEVWRDESSHEAYENHLADGGDPRDHAYYAAAVVLGKSWLFKDDVDEYLTAEAEWRAKFILGDTVTIQGYDISGDKKSAWAIGKKATLRAILELHGTEVGEVLIRDNGPETKLYPLKNLEPA